MHWHTHCCMYAWNKANLSSQLINTHTHSHTLTHRSKTVYGHCWILVLSRGSVSLYLNPFGIYSMWQVHTAASHGAIEPEFIRRGLTSFCFLSQQTSFLLAVALLILGSNCCFCKPTQMFLHEINITVSTWWKQLSAERLHCLCKM